MAKKSIGVFDSGFGGLSILKGIVKRLPQYDYIYLGDSARAPYGPLSSKKVYEFTCQAVEFLFQQHCELIILACNTASAQALRKIQQEYLPAHYPDRRVLGVLIPATEAAVAMSTGRVGILATEGTVRSGTLPAELHKLNPKLQVFQQACPLLVPLIEAGKMASPPAGRDLAGYLTRLFHHRLDTLILGCTHYGLIEHQIRQLISPRIKLINEEKVVPEKLADYLRRHPEIDTALGKLGRRQFYSTDPTDRFQTLGSKFYGGKLNVQAIKLA